MTVQRHEVLDWLGDPALWGAGERDKVADAIIESGLRAEEDWEVIALGMAGDLDLEELADRTLRAHIAYDQHRRRLHAGIRAAVAGGMSEAEAARITGVARMTVRKALGKG